MNHMSMQIVIRTRVGLSHHYLDAKVLIHHFYLSNAASSCLCSSLRKGVTASFLVSTALKMILTRLCTILLSLYD